MDKKITSKPVNSDLVEKILAQGQRLRNAMVESILKNDPLSSDFIYDKHYNSSKSCTEVNLCNVNMPKMEGDKLEAFLRGDFMSKPEELLALETLRSMSAVDLCKVTSRSYSSSAPSNMCNCVTCRAYNENDLSCDLKRLKTSSEPKSTYFNCDGGINAITQQIQDQYRNENCEVLKYVDSLRVSIHSLVLNEAGERKVNVNLKDQKTQVPQSNTFFLEYHVPEFLTNKPKASYGKPRVDTGLDLNINRICSRHRYGQAVTFKHTATHDVSNLPKLDLSKINIKFQINYRNPKQKSSVVLGCAQFNFSSFEVSKNLTCHRGLTVQFNENVPIDLGTLKVSLQLGCGKLYFGKEFLDAINSNKRSSVVLNSDDSACQSQLNIELPQNDVQQVEKKTKETTRNNQETKKSHSITHENSSQLDKVKNINLETATNKRSIENSAYFSEIKPESDRVRKSKKIVAEKPILFGFLYISEAQYLSRPVNSYITCRPFCQDNTCYSRLIPNSSNPTFNFCQVVPLVFEDDLLLQLRENYMLIEFWEKINSTDVDIGITKVSLHQFYLAYRNSDITRYLEKNKLPIVGTDWWEPIYSSQGDDILGQVQVLVALGTEEQIKNLEQDRGFKNNSVRAKFWSPPKPPINKPENERLTRFASVPLTSNRKLVNASVKIKNKPILEKIDVGTQIDLKMDVKKTQEAIDSILYNIVTRNYNDVPPIYKENSTNTTPLQNNANGNTTESSSKAFQPIEESSTNITAKKTSEPSTSRSNDPTKTTQKMLEITSNSPTKKTSDLLDTLEKALKIDLKQPSLQENASFKAHVIIDNALHLPTRRKSKSKKTKSRTGKKEESILPNTYVTFETANQGEIKATRIVQNSSKPKWNFRCDVPLPLDLLTNNNNRLIFKVWRKSSDATLKPDFQSDMVLGFAALDLTVLLAGLPNVQGWFNIIDFAGNCNGQINIHVTPLEDLSRYHNEPTSPSSSSTSRPFTVQNPPVQNEVSEEPGELLSRAMKRKFTELDEITQRLRLRLSKVTNNDDSDCSNDEVANEFERDINTLCIEEDFNLINFAEESKKINPHKEDTRSTNTKTDDSYVLSLASGSGSDPDNTSSCVSLMEVEENRKSTGMLLESDSRIISNKPETNSATTLDKHLLEGRQKIDTLLEKLSLLSTDAQIPFTSRYVSGCSISNDNLDIDTEAILKDLDHSSRPNIQSSASFDPLMFQQLYGGSVYSSSTEHSKSQPTLASSSGTSVITSFSDCRLAPDGQGNTSDDKVASTGSKDD